MICEFCRSTVLESERRWDYHHRHAASLEASVQSGCLFCTRLAEDLGNLGPWFDGRHDVNAVYRWNIRQAYKTRDTQSNISVRFRPVPGRSYGAKRSEHLPDVQFHLYPKDDFETTVDETDLGAGTDSEQTLRQMRAWMDDCVNHHAECTRRHASRDFVPTRVLDVGPPGDDDDAAAWPPSHVRVVNTSETPIRAPYLTLSHCWGDGAFVQLTADNLASFTTRGVPWDDDAAAAAAGGRGITSNATFAQALRVVRQLGQRYLWIDSLCIIQGKGSEGAHVADWKAEAPLMHKVYRNSFCNITAADSRNHTEGLFRPRQQRPGFAPVHYASSGGGGAPSKVFGDAAVWRVLEHDHWDRGLLSRHLYTRGWVFQERLLSPRLLHFGAGQVFWDCAALSASESLPDGLPAALDDASAAAVHRSWRRQLQGATLSVPSLAGSTADSPRGFWADAVRAYTACDLTFPGDRLAAVWGVAKLVRDALGEEYGAGLWTNGLHEQLAWRVVADDRRAGGKAGERGEGNGGGGGVFPSWSWASVRGAVEVAQPVPDLPRFYIASGHDGGALRFLLKNPIFGRFEGEHSASWREELAIMARKLEETSTKMSRKVAAKAANAFAPILEESHDIKGDEDLERRPIGLGGEGDLKSKGPDAKDPAKGPAQNETGIGRDEPKDTGAAKPGPGGKDAATKKKGHTADVPSELLSNEIAIRTHICKGTLQQAAEDGEWTVAVEGVTQDDAIMEAFPDRQPREKSAGAGAAPCEVLLLAVSREVLDELGDWVPDEGYLEEEEVFGTHYSGSALLVERAGQDRFRRVGAVRFRQLDADSWRCLRRACGQDDEMMEGELDVGDGRKVWLL
ncbi:heterokaryon incompatibility protein [Colletotrichum somersetense]|nr:heterokaryon incompatibility protein [Colletotrichum somersetense]